MENQEELHRLQYQQEEDTIDLKEYIFKFLGYWYWFAIAAFIGLAIAYTYNQNLPSSYQVKSLILIEDKKSEGINLEDMFSGYSMSSNVKLENHIGILTSYRLNRQTVENLGWDVSWYEKNFLGDYDLYDNEPFSVDLNPEDTQLYSTPIFITALDGNRYSVRVSSDQVSFEEEGVFGELFQNEFISFTLHKSRSVQRDNCYFLVNNYDQLALSYKNRINASAVEDANMINISLSGQNSHKDIQYVNELVNQYVQYGMEQKNLTSENTIEFIDQQLTDIVDTLRIAGDQLTSFRTDNQVYDIDESASVVLNRLVDLDKEKSLTQIQLDYYYNLRDYMDNAEKMKQVAFPSVVGVEDAGLNSLITGLSTLYTQRETLLLTLNERNPSILQIDKELELTKNSLMEKLNNLVDNTEIELDILNSQIADVNAQLRDYPQTEQELMNFQRVYNLNDELYTFMLEKRAEAQITKASNISDVKVLDEASMITRTFVGPQRMRNLIMGLMAGLVIPFIIILLIDFLDETIHDPEHLQKLTSLPIVGKVGHNPFEPPIPVIEHPRSIFVESLRDLRTNLSFYRKKGEPFVIGVNSVIPGEGKSFIAMNLSAIYAANHKKVVLVGGDMRNPTLQRDLKVKDKDIGLSSYLIGRNTLSEVINETQLSSMDFIPCGLIPPNPAELLESNEFSNLIEELKKSYEVVIIDNSPSTLVTDSAIVSRYTDLDLYVVRQGYSNKHLLDNISEFSKKKKKGNVSIIVNDINMKRYGKYSYRYRGYYRKAYEYVYFDAEEGKKKKLI